MKYNSLEQVAAAFKSGELSKENDYLFIDNDTVFVYHGDEKVYEAHPDNAFEDALIFLGIPFEHA